jgi:hypothetical protein
MRSFLNDHTGSRKPRVSASVEMDQILQRCRDWLGTGDHDRIEEPAAADLGDLRDFVDADYGSRGCIEDIFLIADRLVIIGSASRRSYTCEIIVISLDQIDMQELTVWRSLPSDERRNEPPSWIRWGTTKYATARWVSESHGLLLQVEVESM